MRILITGARGNFPTALIPLLAIEGYELTLFDLEPMDAPEGSQSVQGDIRDAGAVVQAMQGCQAVIHAAGLHTPQLHSRNDNDFFQTNVVGTQNVLRAMQLCGIRHLVYTSTEAVYGDGVRGFRVLEESLDCVPTNIYGHTAWLCEELCRYQARHNRFHIALLRCGCFLPDDWKTEGLELLANRVNRQDVAQAHELALGCVVAEDFGCEAFQIYAAPSILETEWPEMTTNPSAVIERYYPGVLDLLAEEGLAVPPVYHRYEITKAVEQLGYDPQYNFPQFLDRLRSPSRPVSPF